MVLLLRDPCIADAVGIFLFLLFPLYRCVHLMVRVCRLLFDIELKRVDS